MAMAGMGADDERGEALTPCSRVSSRTPIAILIHFPDHVLYVGLAAFVPAEGGLS